MDCRFPIAAMLLLGLAACQRAPDAGPATAGNSDTSVAEPGSTAPALAPPDMAPVAVEPAPATASAPATAPAPTAGPDAWLGKWIGPEGTFLAIEREDAGYQLTIADLDGAKPYQGTLVGDGIEFRRNGRIERIHATDGKATGMKWLADKTDCLTIHAGEGYCRG